MEGVGSFAGHALGDIFRKNLLTKLAAAMVMPGLRAFKAQLDPNKVGGTAFIGISRPVIKAHGSSNAEAIDNAIGQARHCLLYTSSPHIPGPEWWTRWERR